MKIYNKFMEVVLWLAIAVSFVDAVRYTFFDFVPKPVEIGFHMWIVFWFFVLIKVEKPGKEVKNG